MLFKNSIVVIAFTCGIVLTFSSIVKCNEINYKKNYNHLSRHLLGKDENDNEYSITYPEDVHDGHDKNEIPLDIIEKLNDVSNMSEFFSQFIDMDTMDSREVITSRFSGDDDVERSAGQTAKPATCIPQPTVVSLKPEGANDPSVIYFPTCTRMNRCGGCCTHDLLECQPIQVEKRTFQIVKSHYNGRSTFDYKGKEIVIRDEHIKCKCDCRMKESDCKPFQKYEKSQCNCICTNIEEKNKCIGENETKIWDPVNCACRCREGKECTTGSYFDENKCTCLEMPILNGKPISNQQILDRKRFIIKAVPQSDDTKYNTAGSSYT